jgi:hypothetical protein
VILLALIALLHCGQPRARNPAFSALPAALSSRHDVAFGPVRLSGADGERHEALRIGALVVAADVGEGVQRGADGLLTAVVDSIHDLYVNKNHIMSAQTKQSGALRINQRESAPIVRTDEHKYLDADYA